MADEEYGAGELAQGRPQRLDRFKIQMIGRFIQKKQIRSLEEQPAKGHAAALHLIAFALAVATPLLLLVAPLASASPSPPQRLLSSCLHTPPRA